MDFSWTDEQLAFQQKVRDFADEHLNKDTLGENERGDFSWEKWRACAEFGIQGLHVPVEYGGSGRDILSTLLAMEGLGYACRENGFPYAINSQMWSLQPALLKFGNEDQKKKYLPPLCRGEWIGAFGITEAETGSDSYSMQTSAVKCDGGYVINGHKSYITNAPNAEFAVIFAVTDPSQGRWGISAFIVENGTQGFTRSAVRSKMGLRTAHMGDLSLEDCFVEESQRLGAEGAGMSMFTTAMESERGYVFASQLGRQQRQLEESIEYARKREAFGQPIGKFQSVANRIVDMKLRLETARLLLYKLAWLDDNGKSLSIDASLAKLQLSETFVDSSMDAIRVQGVRGYLSEFEVERDLRDGIGGLIYSGTSDIQRVIVARLLGL